jgi:hypothetical protein
MILSTRFAVRIVDAYFDEPVPVGIRADVIRCNQFTKPVPQSSCAPFSTIVLDLSLPVDGLFSKLKTDTRYKIRRASERDGLLYEWSTGADAAQVARFADYFDECASLKGMAKTSRERLMILARHRALAFSCILSGSRAILAANCYIATSARMRILHTAAAFRSYEDSACRNMIGRANRYLFWRDILRLREAGVEIFDFGGWYAADSDADRLRINRFKEEFGGEVRHEWNCQQAMTVKGWLALAALKRRTYLIDRRRPNASVAHSEGKI